MSSRGILFVVALAACHPTRPRTLPVEVRSTSAPVAEAVVIVKCATRVYAGATDARGRVVIPMRDAEEAATCRVLAGYVGYRTLEARPERICGSAPCAPWILTLERGDRGSPR
jgi:hypothetical protein